MEIRYYSADIKDFILELEPKISAEVYRLISLLYKCGNQIKMPHSKSIGRGLFELRIKGKKPIRVIYCFHKGEAILLHIFEKKGNSIPKKELELAKKRRASLA